jgi:hypothetical protein
MHSSRTWGFRLVIALAVTIMAAPAWAQTGSEKRWYERFVDGVAGFVYNVAWPTATYRSVELGSVEFVPGGADVSFRLHGKSAFAEGDLWLDVVMMVRSGAIEDLKWGRHNGFFPPGLTTATMLEVINEALKSAPRSTPAAAPSVAPAPAATRAVSVTCIGNPTAGKVHFALRRGQDSAPFSLEAGQTMIFTAAPADRNFEVTFDNSYADGYQAGTLQFRADVRLVKPETCSDELRLVFVASGQRLGLTTVTWAPGFPAPFDSTVVQSPVKDTWACASGFRPYPWSSGQALHCVGASEGVVGVSLEKPADGGFLRLASVYPGSPAASAGLSAGLFVLSIDGVSTGDMDVASAIERIRGAIGGQFRMGVASAGGQPVVVTLVRQ